MSVISAEDSFLIDSSIKSMDVIFPAEQCYYILSILFTKKLRHSWGGGAKDNSIKQISTRIKEKLYLHVSVTVRNKMRIDT
jgi:hypothetical protein